MHGWQTTYGALSGTIPDALSCSKGVGLGAALRLTEYRSVRHSTSNMLNEHIGMRRTLALLSSRHALV